MGAAITRNTKKFIDDLILYYYDRKKRFDSQKKIFEEEKHEFNVSMERYFDAVCDENSEYSVPVKGLLKDTKIKRIVVKRVSPTKLVFDIDKLKACLDISARKKLIKKKYEVKNWYGLLTYLKSAGVEWKEFLKYVKVTEDVDVDILQNMLSLGEVDEKLITDCTSVKHMTPYYRLSEK